MLLTFEDIDDTNEDEDPASMVIHYFIAPKIIEDHEVDYSDTENEDEDNISNAFDNLGENIVEE